jgi:hypothetical protein
MLTINLRYLYLLGSLTLRPRRVVLGGAADVAPGLLSSHSINHTFLTLIALCRWLRGLSLTLLGRLRRRRQKRRILHGF